MLCKKTVKNQITIPKKIIDKIGDSEYFDVKTEKNRIVLIPVKLVAVNEKSNVLSSVRKKATSLDIKDKDIEDAIEWARSR